MLALPRVHATYNEYISDEGGTRNSKLENWKFRSRPKTMRVDHPFTQNVGQLYAPSDSFVGGDALQGKIQYDLNPNNALND